MGVYSSKLNDEVELLLSDRQADPTVVTEGLHDQLISSFLEIAVGHTVETARNFLHTTNWNLEEAINLFLLHDSHGPSMHHNEQVTAAPLPDETSEDDDDGDDESESRLSSLYRPPYNILFEGSFEDAKSVSTQGNRWLLVNLQSKTEFASHTLNRDVWSNDAVSQAVESSVTLWQVYDDTVEGQKISTFYKLESPPPVVLLLDPITGQKMRMWSGEIEAQGFVEDLVKFMESGPHEHIASLSRHRSLETKVTYSSSNQVPPPSWGEEFEEEDNRSSSNQVVAPSWDEEETCSSSNTIVEPEFEESAEVKEEEEEEEEETCVLFPDLTEEPMGDCDRSLVCNLCVRFPDGRRKQRKFLKTEPVQLLWSFCYSHMERSEKKAFKLVQAIPGASKTLDYAVNNTFDQSGLANSMISVTWE